MSPVVRVFLNACGKLMAFPLAHVTFWKLYYTIDGNYGGVIGVSGGKKTGFVTTNRAGTFPGLSLKTFRGI